MDIKPLAEAPGDPSMEDILASIRRILNDGEAGSESVTAAPPVSPPASSPALHEPSPAPPPAPLPAPEPAVARYTPPVEVVPAVVEPEPVEDVFELDSSMLIEEAVHVPSDTHKAEPAPAAPVASIGTDEGLLAPSAAAAASASLGALVRVVGQRQTPVYRGGPSLEDIVRDEIRPLVKEWLDENLAPMVERMVRAEIERVTRI